MSTEKAAQPLEATQGTGQPPVETIEEALRSQTIQILPTGQKMVAPPAELSEEDLLQFQFTGC